MTKEVRIYNGEKTAPLRNVDAHTHKVDYYSSIKVENTTHTQNSAISNNIDGPGGYYA